MFREEEFKTGGTGSHTDLEYQNRTGKNPDSPTANTPVRVLTASSIIGDEVESPDGNNLGEIKDIMLDIRNGGIEYVILQFGGFLGIGSKYFAIPFESLTINEDRHVFILNKDKSFLEKAPGFDKDHWPETNSEHYTDVNEYWEYTGNKNYRNRYEQNDAPRAHGYNESRTGIKDPATGFTNRGPVA